MQIDPNHQYRLDELPSDIFNVTSGDIKNFNGQQVRVLVNNNNTRTLQPLSVQEMATMAAKQAQDMQVAANKPAINTLSTQYDPNTGKGALVDKYNTLIDSITNAEQPAINTQIQATNTGLGARGITGGSQEGQQDIANSVAPITTQFGQLKAQTGLSEQQDLGGIAAQIAQLQTGNVPAALQFGTGIAQTQAGLQEALITAANNIAVQQLRNQAPQTLGPYQTTLVNPANGQTIASVGNSFSPSPLSGGVNLTSPGSTGTRSNGGSTAKSSSGISSFLPQFAFGNSGQSSSATLR